MKKIISIVLCIFMTLSMCMIATAKEETVAGTISAKSAILMEISTGKVLMELNPEVLDFLPYMDGGLFSCHAKLIKPDPAIYQRLCEKCDLIPEEALFIDDNAANIEAAKRFGLHAIRFEGYEKSYGEVMRYLRETD